MTNNLLYLVNYSSLTMCARYEDEKLPLDHLKHLNFELKNGIYKIKIIQSFDPEDYENDEFIIEYDHVDTAENVWVNIPWF
ncbi:MAG: hypothetical protein ACTSXU_06490 [Promethearchaeota archaeon]